MESTSMATMKLAVIAHKYMLNHKSIAELTPLEHGTTTSSGQVSGFGEPTNTPEQIST